MVHHKVFALFKKLFHGQTPTIKEWYQNGFNSIRIRFVGDEDWVFSYISKGEWRLETLDSFIESLNKNKINGGNKNEI